MKVHSATSAKEEVQKAIAPPLHPVELPREEQLTSVGCAKRQKTPPPASEWLSMKTQSVRDGDELAQMSPPPMLPEWLPENTQPISVTEDPSWQETPPPSTKAKLSENAQRVRVGEEAMQLTAPPY
jgi:hypothetical protein